MELEFLKETPSGGTITNVQLQLAIQTLNRRTRNHGLPAKEILL